MHECFINFLDFKKRRGWGDFPVHLKKKKNLKKFNSSVGFMSNGWSDCEKCGCLTEGWKHWEWWKEVATL